MADLTAADATGTILGINLVGGSPTGRDRPVVDVSVRITVSTATRTDYPTGGILLTNLFTSGNDSDTKLDVTQPIVMIGGGPLRKTVSDHTVSLPIGWSSGTTAATQKLVCYLGDANASDSANREHGNGDMTAATSFGAAGSHVTEITLRGTVRHGESIDGIV